MITNIVTEIITKFYKLITRYSMVRFNVPLETYWIISLVGSVFR